MQDSKIVGVCCQGVSHAKLRLMFRRQDGAGINPPSSRTEEPPRSSKDRTQCILRNSCNLPNELELIVVQASPHVIMELRQNFQWLGSKKPALSSAWNREECLHTGCPRVRCFSPDQSAGADSGLAHQFIARDSD